MYWPAVHNDLLKMALNKQNTGETNFEWLDGIIKYSAALFT